MEPLFAKVNVIHDGKEYKVGDKFVLSHNADGSVATTQDQIDLLKEQGLFSTEKPEGYVEPAVEQNYHANANADLPPSGIPHPVASEQERLEQEQRDRAAAEQANTQAQQVVQPAGAAGEQPSQADIDQTLAATGQPQQ